MAASEHEVRIATGRRDDDGRVRISIFADRLLALSIEGHGERIPTVLLTLDQAKKLKDALSELIPLVEESETAENTMTVEAWQGRDRRLANT
ncbi:MAG: hypothetical protein H0X14_04630 [Acidobacteria bacterium]|nr:hypothetical protein [Acidobacteriota bacterium]